MAKVVLGLARFSNFELFDEEALARDWLERADSEPAATAAAPAAAAPGALRRVALPAGLLASGVVLFRVRRRRRAAALASPTAT